jgi:hypothetical protein
MALIPLMLSVLALPAVARAQTDVPATITQFQLLVLPGTGDPLTATPITTQTTTIGATQNCGIDPATLPPPASSPVTNPLLYTLDDPFTPGRKCRLSFPTGLAAGTYQWAGIFIAASCNPTGTQVLTPCPGTTRGVGTPGFSIADRISRPPVVTGLKF